MGRVASAQVGLPRSGRSPRRRPDLHERHDRSGGRADPHAPFCDEDGKMVGDGTVFKFDDEHAWVITALDSDLEHFEQVVDDLDVEIGPITPTLPYLQLQGPRSRDLLASL